jgi:excinuclease ABC subunit C
MGYALGMRSMTPRERFEEKLRLLPPLPGVYLFKNAYGEVVYVGKAKRLDRRVASYFTGEPAHPKTRALISVACDIDTIVTHTEMEALILELTLIQQHKPLYNINLKDDKSYPFLRISVQEEVPRLSITRHPTNDGARYFGPFTQVKVLRETLKLIRTLFPVRTCPILPTKACFNYHIGRCTAPCDGHISVVDHRAIVDDLVAFLSGKGHAVVARLHARMDALARERKFEAAAEVRDQIHGIERLLTRQNVAVLGDYEADAIGIARQGDLALMTILKVREGNVVGSEQSRLSGVAARDDADVLDAALAQHYARAAAIPREVLVTTLPTNAALLESWLAERASHSVTLRVPQRGRGISLVQMALRNALHELERARGDGSSEWVGDVPAQELARVAGLSSIPRRIEGYDVSNLGGTYGCVSLVTFLRGQPRRSDYRKFRIRTVQGQDDFAMLREALTRRFTGSLSHSLPFPDLIMVDGGHGQVAAAAEALAVVGHADMPLLGLAKRYEEIYVHTGGGKVAAPLRLPRRSDALRLLQRIRDEAHRVVVTYNRTLRRPAVQHSILEDVPGLGPTRARRLLTELESLERIRAASVEEVARVKGIGPRLARVVSEWLLAHPSSEATVACASHEMDREPRTDRAAEETGAYRIEDGASPSYDATVPDAGASITHDAERHERQSA